MNEAHEGQQAVEVACGCDATTLVLAHKVGEWRCGKCRRKATPTGRTVVLGPGGALPDGWRDQPLDDSQASGEQMEGPYSARFPSVQSGRNPGERPHAGSLPIAERCAS